MKILAKGSFGALLLTTAMSVAAFPVDVTSITGTFENAIKSDGSAAAGNGTSMVSWGDDSTSGFPFYFPVSGQKSSYEFSGASPLPIQIDDDSIFSLGMLTHINRKPRGATLTSTDLALTLGFAGVGDTGASEGKFVFAHDETLNDGTYQNCWWIFCSTKNDGPVADTVTQTGASVISSSFILGSFAYSLELLGLTEIGSTPEDSSREYGLFAKLNATAVPVPEPGTLALLGLGLAGLGMSRRRKA